MQKFSAATHHNLIRSFTNGSRFICARRLHSVSFETALRKYTIAHGVLRNFGAFRIRTYNQVTSAITQLRGLSTTSPLLQNEQSLDNLRHQLHQYTASLNPLKPVVPNDLFVSCTIMKKNGTVVGISQKFPKWQFLKDHDLYPRDLRKIDTSTIDNIPSIVVKPNKCILVNLLHIKALIKANEVMIFDTVNPVAAHGLGELMYDLEVRFQHSTAQLTLPFEFQVLEIILINVLNSLEVQLNNLEKQCGGILKDLENEIDRNKLKDLLIRSKNLSAFYKKTLLIRDVLDEILDNDEDLQGLCLTNNTNKDSEALPNQNHGNLLESAEDVEMLLETYYYQCDEFVQKSESLIQNIKSTEEIVNIILDSNRNSLMLFELKITIYTLGFTVATLLPAFYGMNLKNFIEESDLGFAGVILVSSLAGIIITMTNFKALRSVTRLTLMNNHSGKNTKTHIDNAEMKTQKFVPTVSSNLKNWKRKLHYLMKGENSKIAQVDRLTSKREAIRQWLIQHKTDK